MDIQSPNHALLVGNIIGKIMSIDNCIAEPIMKNGNYTADILVKRGGTEYIVTITPME